MSTYVAVFVNDDGMPYAYGPFRSEERADAVAERIERDLDEDRDVAGGGAGMVRVCRVEPPEAWS
jgi:hypothetical protein